MGKNMKYSQRPKLLSGYRESSKLNMDDYLDYAGGRIRNPLSELLQNRQCTYVNTRELDDLLCEKLKDSDIYYDGYRRWIEVHRSVRIRIMTRVLMREFGYLMWSGSTKKILYKPLRDVS
jgi:hypothetical protein